MGRGSRGVTGRGSRRWGHGMRITRTESRGANASTSCGGPANAGCSSAAGVVKETGLTLRSVAREKEPVDCRTGPGPERAIRVAEGAIRGQWARARPRNAGHIRGGADTQVRERLRSRATVEAVSKGDGCHRLIVGHGKGNRHPLGCDPAPLSDAERRSGPMARSGHCMRLPGSRRMSRNTSPLGSPATQPRRFGRFALRRHASTPGFLASPATPQETAGVFAANVAAISRPLRPSQRADVNTDPLVSAGRRLTVPSPPGFASRESSCCGSPPPESGRRVQVRSDPRDAAATIDPCDCSAPCAARSES